MSDLQIGLISLGVVLILVVVSFNWWQDRRVRQKMQEHFPETEQDPLMGGLPPVASARREPGLGLHDPQSETLADDTAEVDPNCEAVIDIEFSQAVASDQLHAALQAIHKVGNKPVRLFVEREGGGHRARLRPGEFYKSMQLAVLLANRSGPLTDIEWSHLWVIAQGLAERFDGIIEAPEQALVLDRARRLDELCAGLDAQVGLALRLGGTRPVVEMTQAAKDVGFLSRGAQLAWMADSGVARFTLLFDGAHAGEVQSAGVDR
ncbi:MAG TPA: hypothetical protein VIR04_03830, partial [Paralcaligenes sp.]